MEVHLTLEFSVTVTVHINPCIFVLAPERWAGWIINILEIAAGMVVIRSKDPRPGRFYQSLASINGEHIGLLKKRYSFLLNLKSPSVAAKDDSQFVSSRMVNVQTSWMPILLLTLLCGLFYVLIPKARKRLLPTIWYPRLKSIGKLFWFCS